MKKLHHWLICVCAAAVAGSLPEASAQVSRLNIVSPAPDSSTVDRNITYLRGMADPEGTLLLDGDTVTVYSTGVFAAALPLKEGINAFEVKYILKADTLRKRMVVVYEKPLPPEPTAGFAIESVRLLQGGDDIWLQPGDLLQVEMKATPGMKATFHGDVPLFEVDTAETHVGGIYRGEYRIQQSDNLSQQPVSFRLRDAATGKTVTFNSRERLTVLTQPYALTALTRHHQTPLYYGLGSDRLGGAKMGTLDSLVKVEVTGKMSGMYRVRLSGQMQAYVPVRDLELQSGVHFRPSSLTGSWTVYSDSTDDFVSIGLKERLPYTASVRNDPTRIIVDVYGAVSNSNWITQKEGLQAIGDVWYEQVSKEVFRVYIELKSKQLWGYDVGYQGHNLVIRVKPQPADLALRSLTVAVDAGHGGSNRGATGLTGVLEKDLNLSMAMQLKAALERLGARVIMTREGDRSVSNSYRVRWLQEQDPDLLVSIHCNASANPLVQGTSTYYRHQAYRPVSQHILEEMRDLGLEDFGNVGGFNFTLNAPTAFPSVLVEVAFLSNPADEEKLLDPKFHGDVAGKIVAGLRGFLESVNGGG